MTKNMPMRAFLWDSSFSLVRTHIHSSLYKKFMPKMVKKMAAAPTGKPMEIHHFVSYDRLLKAHSGAVRSILKLKADNALKIAITTGGHCKKEYSAQ